MNGQHQTRSFSGVVVGYLEPRLGAGGGLLCRPQRALRRVASALRLAALRSQLVALVLQRRHPFVLGVEHCELRGAELLLQREVLLVQRRQLRAQALHLRKEVTQSGRIA